MNVFLGVCEDNNSDPLKMGRIKARIFGVHTEIKNGKEDHKGISTNDLPWSMPCYPINTQTIDGMSDFQVPVNGSIVLICFLDEDKQKPVYFGTMPRILEKLPNYNFGFSDPDKDHPNKEYIDESPISRLARNEKIDKTIIQEKKDTIKKNVVCADERWTEPKTPYNTEYTKNRVIETHSGHFIELDDTDGAERIHIYHRTGSSQEYHNNGDVVDRINNSRFTIVLTDDNILIEGDQNVHINIDQNSSIDRDVRIDIGHDREETIANYDTTSAGNTIHLNAGSLIKITAPLVTIN